MTGGYMSFGEQTRHYFDRPHETVPQAPLALSAAWAGSNMPPLDDMAYRLSPADLNEIDRALDQAKASGKATRDLTRDDFPLPGLGPQFARWRETLAHCIGVQVIRGVPVARFSQADAELFFWCFGLHLGRPGGQNQQGDLLGHVRDMGDPSAETVRLYRTVANIDYHCDAADVVGLLCLNKAKSGGRSRIVSSVSVFNRLVAERPDLAARLFEPVLLDNRERPGTTGKDCIPITPCRFAGGKLRTFYHSDYFRSVARHTDLPPPDPTLMALYDAYEAIAMDPALYWEMDLEPGDIQLLSNHIILHARTNYMDWEEPARKRHLLRLWLSL